MSTNHLPQGYLIPTHFTAATNHPHPNITHPVHYLPLPHPNMSQPLHHLSFAPQTMAQPPTNQQTQDAEALRIRIVALENDLLHANKDKEVLKNSLAIVIESLTQTHHAFPSTSTSTTIPSSAPSSSTQSQPNSHPPPALQHQTSTSTSPTKCIKVEKAEEGGEEWKGKDEGRQREKGHICCGETPQLMKELEREISFVRAENRQLRKEARERAYGLFCRPAVGTKEVNEKAKGNERIKVDDMESGTFKVEEVKEKEKGKDMSEQIKGEEVQRMCKEYVASAIGKCKGKAKELVNGFGRVELRGTAGRVPGAWEDGEEDEEEKECGKNGDLLGLWQNTESETSGVEILQPVGEWNGPEAGVQYGEKGFMPQQLVGSWGIPEAGVQYGENGLTPEQLIGSWAYPSSGAQEAGPSNLNNTFNSDSTTVPNTPNSSFEANPNTSFADVGLHSLEENMHMDNDGFPPAITFPPASNSNNSIGEEDKDIDAQLLDQAATLHQFKTLPKPSVIHVGFSLEGVKRGSDYDAHPLHTPTFTRTHSMREYNRFGPSVPTAPRSMRSYDSDLALRIPADLSNSSTLWSEGERKEAAEIHMRSVSSRARDAEMNFPEFFRYGISYSPSVSDSNYLRTVMLSNIPISASLRDVLARVRGGEVLSASLLDTVQITGSLSARVVFRHEAAAEEYALYCSSRPLIFSSDSEDQEQKVEVTLLQTPTYPLSPRAHQRLSAHGQTRCLTLASFPSHLSLTALERSLSSNNGRRGDMLVEMFIDTSGTLHLQFSDVFWAGAAYGMLRSRSEYRSLSVQFSPDPCAGPVKDLSLPPKARPPMLPLNWAELQRQYADGWKIEEGGGGERKPLPALANQKVEIPSFSYKGQGESWADEVIDELESSPSDPQLEAHSEVPPNSPEASYSSLGELLNSRVLEPVEGSIGEGKVGIDALVVENINKSMTLGSSTWWRDEGLSQPPVGLAGSAYASRSPVSHEHEKAIKEDGAKKRRKLQTTPPRVNLHNLIASNPEVSPTTSVTSSRLSSSGPDSPSPRKYEDFKNSSLKNEEAILRQPRLPPPSSFSGFGKSKVDELCEVKNPDEIAIFSDSED